MLILHFKGEFSLIDGASVIFEPTHNGRVDNNAAIAIARGLKQAHHFRQFGNALLPLHRAANGFGQIINGGAIIRSAG